jgi:hypothetical protein
MTFRLCASIYLVLASAAVPLRAVNPPHTEADGRNVAVRTTSDVQEPHDLRPISIGDGSTGEGQVPAPSSELSLRTQDPEWYAERSATLRDELERRRAQLADYRQALEDARSLKRMAGGMNFAEGDVAITPEAGIEILQQSVSEVQTELAALEDLARRHGIPPGTLRGQ